MESSIIAKMKVPDLKNRLIELGLESKGLKAVLIARLNEYYETCRRQRLMTRNDENQKMMRKKLMKLKKLLKMIHLKKVPKKKIKKRMIMKRMMMKRMIMKRMMMKRMTKH
jgi:hypothetical protein